MATSDHYPYMTPWLWSQPLMQVSTDTARWILWVNGNDLPSLTAGACCIGSIGSGSQSSKRLSYTMSRDYYQQLILPVLPLKPSGYAASYCRHPKWMIMNWHATNGYGPRGFMFVRMRYISAKSSRC